MGSNLVASVAAYAAPELGARDRAARIAWPTPDADERVLTTRLHQLRRLLIGALWLVGDHPISQASRPTRHRLLEVVGGGGQVASSFRA